MAKYFIKKYNLGNEEYYYISFDTDNYDNVLEELNIPYKNYIEICVNNGAVVMPSISEDQDVFKTEIQARKCLQELLEYALEFNKCDCDDIPIFPNDFSSDEKDATDEEINEMIGECVDILEENIEMEDINICQGSTLVLVNRFRKCIDPECPGYYEYYYDYVVCKGIYEYSENPELEEE